MERADRGYSLELNLGLIQGDFLWMSFSAMKSYFLQSGLFILISDIYLKEKISAGRILE
jgi:hypothetical protein